VRRFRRPVNDAVRPQSWFKSRKIESRRAFP
jgi:hypothetical protein